MGNNEIMLMNSLECTTEEPCSGETGGKQEGLPGRGCVLEPKEETSRWRGWVPEVDGNSSKWERL